MDGAIQQQNAALLVRALSEVDSDELVAVPGLPIWRLAVGPHAYPKPYRTTTLAETGYVVEGYGRLTVMDSEGRADSYVIGPGDRYFVPPVYRHRLDNVGAAMLKILIAFDGKQPQGIEHSPIAVDDHVARVAGGYVAFERESP